MISYIARTNLFVMFHCYITLPSCTVTVYISVASDHSPHVLSQDSFFFFVNLLSHGFGISSKLKPPSKFGLLLAREIHRLYGTECIII